MSSKRISYIHLQDDGTLDVNFTRVTEQVMPQIVYILHGKLWSRDCLLDPGVIPVCRLWEPSEINTRNSAFVPDVTCCNWIIYLFVAYICLMHQGIV